MNINEMRKNDLNNSEDLRSFVKKLMIGNDISFEGPLGLANTIYDSVMSNDENLMVQVWLSISYKLATFFAANSEENSHPERFVSYIKLIKELLIRVRDSVKTIPHMKSLRKWVKLIFPELSDKTKALFYAFDSILFKALNDVITYIPLAPFLHEEDIKVTTLVESYLSFIKNELKDSYEI